MSIRVLMLSMLTAVCALRAQQPLRTQRVAAPTRRVDLHNTYHRVIAVVPIVGSGTRTDPRRPAYVPLLTPGRMTARSGIIAFSFLESDDKKSAIVEFVAADPAALKPILADKSLTVFDKGKARRADIEAQLQKQRKNFNLDQLRVMVP